MIAAALLLLMPGQLVETFDGPDLPLGWIIVNNSQPPGEFSWGPGSPTFFPPHAGDGFAAVNPQAAAPGGAVSAWLISPVVEWRRGTQVSFWTRAAGPWPDRMECRVSLAGESVNVGSGPFTVGDFQYVATEINLQLEPNGYPQEWTQCSFRVDVPEPIKGRLAFRYFLNSNEHAGSYVGVDSVSVMHTQRRMGDLWNPGGR